METLYIVSIAASGQPGRRITHRTDLYSLAEAFEVVGACPAAWDAAVHVDNPAAIGWSAEFDEVALPRVTLKRRPGRPAKYGSQAERQAAYRARNGVTLSVVIPADIAEAFKAYVARQMADGAGLTQAEVVEKLIRSQVLRKR